MGQFGRNSPGGPSLCVGGGALSGSGRLGVFCRPASCDGSSAMNGTLTDVAGLTVGHWTNLEAGTGCTVIICPPGTVGGVDVRGSAPGTRETDLLDPINMVQQVDAVVLSGGSAYGLAAADGVMRWLEEHG